MDSPNGLRAGGDSGPLWVTGDPENSKLVQMISGDEPEMPLDGDPLAADEVSAIRDWIRAGSPFPEDWPVPRNQNSTHWSLQAIMRPPLPIVRDSQWPRNEIDFFVLAELEQNQLTPSQPADRRTLIRRLTYDICGLAPAFHQAQQFVDDSASWPYEKEVERLLESPHYGERWGRYWLDVVRFAESNGFETNLPRPNAWHYRDYVIRALNEDRPFDQFVMEQLVGDQRGATEATGFLVAGAWDQVKSPDPVLTANQRADELHDMVSTTGSAFLGLTVGCARCHDHKFDPISQTDYYAMAACLTGVQHGERPLRTEVAPEVQSELGRLREQLSQVESKLREFEPISAVAESTPETENKSTGQSPSAADPVTAKRAAVRPDRNVDRFSPVQAKLLRLSISKTTDVEPCIDEIEVFLADGPTQNVALAQNGTRATASSVFPNSDIHRLEHLNDGRYGNERSWISNEQGKGWIQLEFADPVTIDRVVWARDRQKQFRDRLALDYTIEVSGDGELWQTVSTSNDRRVYDVDHAAPNEFVHDSLSNIELERLNQCVTEREQLEARIADLSRLPMVYAGTFATQPDATFRFFRGDPMQKREPVEPGALSTISVAFKLPSHATESDRRLALAQWIVDPTNPLTARVIVNRLWQYHFGEGLVATPSDFGANGARPSHPELLDWLAVELVENHWSLKHIHRLILNSNTYRQSSALRPECFAVDADSKWIWRYPPRRLEAEPIRDSILLASGKLDSRMAGAGYSVFQPNDNYVRVYSPLTEFGPEQFRRMIYATAIRQRLDGVFGAFDCPDGGQIAPRRNRSTTPLQALNLLNSRFMTEQAGFMADRLQSDVGSDIPRQVRRAFELAYQRRPSPEEQESAESVARLHGVASVCRALLSSSEFIYVY